MDNEPPAVLLSQIPRALHHGLGAILAVWADAIYLTVLADVVFLDSPG